MQKQLDCKVKVYRTFQLKKCKDSLVLLHKSFHLKILHIWSSGVCLLVGCLMSQLHASVSQGQICTDNFMCCHTEI